MKTYLRDFSISNGSLSGGINSELEEVIANRNEKFRKTVEYHETKKEVLDSLKKLENLLPEEKSALGQLEDFIFHMECICFSAGYRDGICDLMATMTMNKLGLAKVEYWDLSKGA